MNLSGLKVYETNENELVMEPAFRWAGNPNIVLVLKLLSLRITIQVRNEYTIPEMKNLFIYMLLCSMHFFQNTDFAYSQLVDLQVFAAPRVTLKPLVPIFPCFASIVVSLLEKVSKEHTFIFALSFSVLNLDCIDRMIFSDLSAATCRFWNQNIGRGHYVHSRRLSVCSGVTPVFLFWL